MTTVISSKLESGRIAIYRGTCFAQGCLRPATYTGAAKMLCRDLSSSCVPYYVEPDAVSPQSPRTSPQRGARYDDKNRRVLKPNPRPWSYGRRGHRERPGTIRSAVSTGRRTMADFFTYKSAEMGNLQFRSQKQGGEGRVFERNCAHWVFGGFPRAMCTRDF